MKAICNSVLTLLFVIFFAELNFGQASVGNDTIRNHIFLLERYLDFKPTSVVENKKSYFNNFNPNNLPIFCKIEHQIEKSSKIGFRFRLGDLNYVNMLENKN